MEKSSRLLGKRNTCIFLLTATAIVFLAEIVLCGLYADRRGMVSSTYNSVSSFSTYISTMGGMYPPGPPVFYFLARTIWDAGSPFWNGLLCLGTALGIFFLSKQGKRLADGFGWGFLASLLLLLNVYGIWSMIISGDTALENICFIWAVFGVVHFCKITKPGMAWYVVICIIPLISCMMRLSSFIMWFWVFVFMMLVWRRLRIIPALVVLVVFGFAYCLWNYNVHQEFTLTTTSKSNLFLGNHPRYLDVHPQNDIEVLNGQLLREQQAIEERLTSPSSVKIRKELGKLTLGYIRQDPSEALLRSALKLHWYFLGINKIPLFSAGGRANLQDENILILGDRDSKISLAHLPYGILFVILFWLSLIYFVRQRYWGDVLYYIPFIVIGLFVGMILFPDTRFRQAAEILTYVPIAKYLMTKPRIKSILA